MVRSMVSVVIANYNGKNYLRGCLESVFRQTLGPLEIIVVDNGSTDGSKEMLQTDFPQVELIANEHNELYCRAQNQGIRRAKGEFIICLNNDLVLDEHFVEELVRVADIDPHIGMVCGKIISWDKKTIDSAGQLLGKSRRPIERDYKKPDTGKYDQPSYIFSAGGVAPLYKRKMLEELKIDGEYFDEDYGMFYEDLDLAWRANLFGWRGYYNPRALAYHRRGATAKTKTPVIGFLRRYDLAYLSPQLQLCLVKNRYMTILKNDKVGSFLFNLPFILAYEIKLWSYFITFRPHLIFRMIKNLSYLKPALRKRRIIQINLEQIFLDIEGRLS